MSETQVMPLHELSGQGLGRKGSYQTKARKADKKEVYLRPCPFLLSYLKGRNVGWSNAIDLPAICYGNTPFLISYRPPPENSGCLVPVCLPFLPLLSRLLSTFSYICPHGRFGFSERPCIFISTSPGDVRHSLVLVRAASRVIPCRCVSRPAIRNALIYFPGGIP